MSPGRKLMERLLISRDIMDQLKRNIQIAERGCTGEEEEREGVRLPRLETQRGEVGGEEYEKLLRLSLILLHTLIQKRDSFVNVLRRANNPTNAVQEIHLALRDTIPSIALFGNYPFDDEVCLYVVRVLDELCRRSPSEVEYLRRDEKTERTIRENFYLRLCTEDAIDEEDEEVREEMWCRESSVRMAILVMILENISKSSFTISHLLLGFRPVHSRSGLFLFSSICLLLKFTFCNLLFY